MRRRCCICRVTLMTPSCITACSSRGSRFSKSRSRLKGWLRSCERSSTPADGVAAMVPTVVPRNRLLTVAGRRSLHCSPCNHNGQRWLALAVPDYESRALPLSYGGGHPHLPTDGSLRDSALTIQLL